MKSLFTIAVVTSFLSSVTEASFIKRSPDYITKDIATSSVVVEFTISDWQNGLPREPEWLDLFDKCDIKEDACGNFLWQDRTQVAEDLAILYYDFSNCLKLMKLMSEENAGTVLNYSAQAIANLGGIQPVNNPHGTKCLDSRGEVICGLVKTKGYHRCLIEEAVRRDIIEI